MAAELQGTGQAAFSSHFAGCTQLIQRFPSCQPGRFKERSFHAAWTADRNVHTVSQPPSHAQVPSGDVKLGCCSMHACHVGLEGHRDSQGSVSPGPTVQAIKDLEETVLVESGAKDRS